ncbi:hypothetical protein IWW34DRAFT_753417 [Fusarium oxysporum f. sp. albedinis]|nr:hypothetical protein IWW34DRAFT_753417 [Fusarium oxysporum f. sp. albedinis]
MMEMAPPNGIPGGQIRFINVSSSAYDDHVLVHRSAIQSHAAHVTHARARRARFMSYQSTRTATTHHRHIKPKSRDDDEVGVLPDPTNLQRAENARPRLEITFTTGSILASPLSTAAQKDPFMSYGTRFTAIEEMLLNHYITILIPKLGTICSGARAHGPEYLTRMNRKWIQLGLSSPAFLNGIFLNASRHISGLYNEPQTRQQFTNLATRYKLASVKDLSDAICLSPRTKPFGDSLIALTMALALDELSNGDLAMSRHHVHGALRMVDLNGGPHTLGLEGFLELILTKYAREIGPLVQVPTVPCQGLNALGIDPVSA